MKTIYSFIIGEPTFINELCFESVKQSPHYKLVLYGYGLDSEDLPDHVVLKDASEILSLDAKETANSDYALTSMFKYKLLHTKGGLWIDPDVVLLDRKIPTDREFILVEYDEEQLSKGILGTKRANRPFFNLMFEMIRDRDHDRLDELMEIRLLTKIVRYTSADQFIPHDKVYSTRKSGLKEIFKRTAVIPDDLMAFHVNETFIKEHGYDMTDKWGSRTIAEQLKRRFGLRT